MSENSVRQIRGREVLICIVKKISNEPPETSVRLHKLVTSLQTNRDQGPITLRQLPEAYLTCSSLSLQSSFLDVYTCYTVVFHICLWSLLFLRNKMWACGWLA